MISITFLYYSSLILWLMGVYFLKDLKIRLIKQRIETDYIISELVNIRNELQKRKYVIQVYKDFAKIDELIIDKNELVTN